MKELLYNDTLKNETDTEDGIPIAQKIKSVNCPRECSGKGICENGKQKMQTNAVSVISSLFVICVCQFSVIISWEQEEHSLTTNIHVFLDWKIRTLI